MSGFKPERGSAEWHQQRAGVERGSAAWNALHGSTSADGRNWYTKKRFIIPTGVLGLFVWRVATAPEQAPSSTSTDWNRSTSLAGLDTADQPMGFEECNRRIRSIADDLGITPSNIVDSNAMRIVRFNAANGSVLVTCDAIDEKMIVVNSPHGG